MLKTKWNWDLIIFMLKPYTPSFMVQKGVISQVCCRYFHNSITSDLIYWYNMENTTIIWRSTMKNSLRMENKRIKSAYFIKCCVIQLSYHKAPHCAPIWGQPLWPLWPLTVTAAGNDFIHREWTHTIRQQPPSPKVKGQRSHLGVSLKCVCGCSQINCQLWTVCVWAIQWYVRHVWLSVCVWINTFCF